MFWYDVRMQSRVIAFLAMMLLVDVLVFAPMALWAWDGFSMKYMERPWVGFARIAMMAVLAVLALTVQAFLAKRLAR